MFDEKLEHTRRGADSQEVTVQWESGSKKSDRSPLAGQSASSGLVTFFLRCGFIKGERSCFKIY